MDLFFKKCIGLSIRKTKRSQNSFRPGQEIIDCFANARINFYYNPAFRGMLFRKNDTKGKVLTD